MSELSSMISVIVPIYNLEQYLSKCVDSLLCQTYENFELILVDDGSKDLSGKICDEYAEKDARVRAIHQVNQGVSAARNRGISESKGAYIAFVDGDDYVDSDYLKVLFESLCENNADISCCNYATVENGIVDTTAMSFSECGMASTSQGLFRNFYESLGVRRWSYATTVWAKLFRKEILEAHEFSKLKYGEDTLFMFETFAKGPKISFNTHCGYYYYFREGSATQTKDPRQSIEVVLQRLIAYKYPVYEVELEPAIQKLAVATLANIIQELSGVTIQVAEKVLFNEYRPIIKKEIVALQKLSQPYNCIGKTQKIKFWLYMNCPYSLYCLVIKVWKAVRR